MSEELNLDISELRRARSHNGGHSREHHEQHGERNGPRGHTGQTRASSTRVTGTSWAGSGETLHRAGGPINFWLLSEMLLRRWTWLVLAGAGCTLIAFLLGLKITSYTAKVALIRRENPNAFTAGGGDNAAPQAYLSRELSAQTLFALMRSPEVFRRASEKTEPRVRPDQLARAMRVIPERNADFVTLAVSGKEPKEALAKWANLCADEVVSYTKELQAAEAGSIADFLRLKLIAVDNELKHVNENMTQFAEQSQTLDVDKEVEAYASQLAAIETRADTARIERASIDSQIETFQKALSDQSAPANDRVQTAEDELQRLLARGYTVRHPDVAAQRALIARLRQQGTNGLPVELQAHGGSYASAIQLHILELQSTKKVRDRELEEYEGMKTKLQEKAKRLTKTAVQYAALRAGQRRFEDLKVTLQSKQQEAQLLRDDALGYFKVFSYASPDDVTGRKRLFTVILLAAVGGLLGLFAASGMALIAEALDHRIKTASDLERATQLPVMATLGDLRTMSPDEQINWAFRTLTLLQGKLNASSDQTLVCGLISSRHGEGRSTWINLLVSAASQRGMRVLTVATRPSTEQDEELTRAPKNTALLPMGPATTLTKNVLAYPAQVTEQFNDPQAQPIVHIPLPGWVWNLERRHQWRAALESWENIENLVLLIELPPACQPESVLLAEHLPQIIWLAGSGQADMEETRSQLDTLRHAHCNLVGAVLNREPTTFFRKHLGPWIRRFSLLLASAALLPITQAAAPGPEINPANPRSTLPNMSFSFPPAQRAPWQEHLTLGPGDAFDLFVYGHPDLSRTNLIVGPDGRIRVNFADLDEVPAAGLTVDELRARLDQSLAPFFTGGVRTIVSPNAFYSKKYFVLGKVVAGGVYILDRPVTIVEAVARARGLQSGAFDRGSADAADLTHSFLARGGKRVPVDFAKLFYEGDLSQNVALEPNDYLYFAPAALQEIYVLGEVLAPGRVVATSGATLLRAIAARGGLTPQAYSRRVLVVRGSLQHPEAFAIDAPAILAGRTPDFKLQAKDIVYVNKRPWLKVEELLDVAAQSFIDSAVTIWAGANVPAVFTSPVFPKL